MTKRTWLSYAIYRLRVLRIRIFDFAGADTVPARILRGIKRPLLW